MNVRRHRFVRVVAFVASLLLCFAWHAHADYEPGRGLPLFHDRLTIGGYVAVDAAFLDDSRDELVVDDLSAFLTLRLTDHWLLFTEAELEDPVHIESGGFGSGDHLFNLERLYSQWLAGEHVRLRIGQMLTPFGIWNVIHAEPLVWTSSRPIATAEFFDTSVTGMEATLFAPVTAFDLIITAFGQVTPQIDDSHDPQKARRAVGARAEAGTSSGVRVGASVVHFHDHVDHRDETTFGVDAFWTARLVELSSEIAINAPDSGHATGGGYAQIVWHAGLNLHPFVRVEYVDLRGFDRVPVVFGAAWKPYDAIVFKLEGILGGDDTSLGGDGVLSSFSMLF